jgi:transcriptional regulator with XRE-family HTH domain
MAERRGPKRPLDHKPAAVTRARERLGLTRKQVADALDVSPSLITEIEKGTRNATPAMILRLAPVLRCRPDTLRRRPLDALQKAAVPDDEAEAEPASAAALWNP